MVQAGNEFWGILRFLRGVPQTGNVKKIEKLIEKPKCIFPNSSPTEIALDGGFTALLFSTVSSTMVENRLLKFPELQNNVNKKGRVVKKCSNVTLCYSQSWKLSLRRVGSLISMKWDIFDNICGC